jgi:hypothetical protein
MSNGSSSKIGKISSSKLYWKQPMIEHFVKKVY